MKYICHNCGYKWTKENGREYESCIVCGTIFVEVTKEVLNDKT
jgi:transposase-like protein